MGYTIAKKLRLVVLKILHLVIDLIYLFISHAVLDLPLIIPTNVIDVNCFHCLNWRSISLHLSQFKVGGF